MHYAANDLASSDGAAVLNFDADRVRSNAKNNHNNNVSVWK